MSENGSQSQRAGLPPVAPPPRPFTPGLYIAATPIGNLRDVTLRLLDLLSAADLVLCEDTRVTQKLLSAYGLSVRLQPYHDHNAEKVRPRIIEELRKGGIIALVSDAGTPLISDPGLKLVRAAAEEGLPVSALPGPSAPLAALTLAGLPTDRVLFTGFLPTKAGARHAEIDALRTVAATLVFFESPRRLGASLKDLAAAFGDREAAIARELTKRFEEVRRGTLGDLAAAIEEEPVKGEVVILVGPPDKADRAADPEEVDRALEDALKTASVRDAVRAVVLETGAPRREVYARAIALSKQVGPQERPRDGDEPEEGAR